MESISPLSQNYKRRGNNFQGTRLVGCLKCIGVCSPMNTTLGHCSDQTWSMDRGVIKHD